MKQSSKRLLSIVGALLMVVVALVILFDLIQPEYQTIESLKGQVLGSQNFLKNETQTVDQVQKIISTYQSQSQGEQDLSLALPSGPDIAGALAQIYGIAQNNQIAITTITISAPVIQSQAGSTNGTAASQLIKPMGSMTFQVQAAGSYENLKSFAAQMETNVRIFDMKGISIHPSTAVVTVGKNTIAANPDYFNFDITYSTYYEIP